MTTKMWSLHTKMRNYLWTKYCLSSHLYCPFMGIEEELCFIPEKYHALYLRVQQVEDPLHEFMVWTVEGEASNY